MYQILLIFHLMVAIFLIALIMLQQGKGAQAGAAFGSGASGTVFGSQGSGNFLSRSTAVLVTLFFIVNLSLAHLTNKYSRAVLLDDLPISTLSNEIGEVVNQDKSEKTVSSEVPQSKKIHSSIPE